jgi:drug/metabolite transporter (DMT)-like permease
MNKYLILMFVLTFFSAVSQLLLKLSANEPHEGRLGAYLNKKVITAYFIFGVVLLLNTYAYTKVNLKYGPVIDTFTYVFVLLLSVLVLKEKLTGWKLLGNIMIICGVLLFSLEPF